MEKDRIIISNPNDPEYLRQVIKDLLDYIKMTTGAYGDLYFTKRWNASNQKKNAEEMVT